MILANTVRVVDEVLADHPATGSSAMDTGGNGPLCGQRNHVKNGIANPLHGIVTH